MLLYTILVLHPTALTWCAVGCVSLALHMYSRVLGVCAVGIDCMTCMCEVHGRRHHAPPASITPERAHDLQGRACCVAACSQPSREEGGLRPPCIHPSRALGEAGP